MDEEQSSEETSAPDEKRENLLAELSENLGEMLIDSYLRPHEDLWLRVRIENWQDAVKIAKAAGFTYFGFLSAIDWDIAPDGRYENTEFDGGLVEEDDDPVELDTSTGYAGGDSRFQLLAQLNSLDRQMGLILKADLGDNLVVDTIRDVFPGADWHERETHEMFGIVFRGHPTLHPLYLPTEFEGHPLRKDFPLLARQVKPWPGVVDIEEIPEHLEAQLEAEVMAAFEAEGGEV
ncbi:MAG TPA: NADH-quinone oxidoreductase subunit C [Acidimicrobiales bacterium]|jgi:NADH-quinone oxidoreductase subunit C|nr:NADH-quinone oxidoreductase subunit C [Acidimicrobiales bacterium]|tara:strand:- start:14800 stop:15501 length:702 start_codon:yes stop_codon:yes gene_type:complete